MALNRAWATLLAILLLTTTAGCADEQRIAFGEQHEARMKKAAGITLIKIVCIKDLWERTSGGSLGRNAIKGKVTAMPNGLVTVELTGPELVDYLDRLQYDGFRGGNDPLAARMYNGIAPVVDKVQPGAASAGKVPEVRIDDPVGGANTPTPSGTPKASPS